MLLAGRKSVGQLGLRDPPRMMQVDLWIVQLPAGLVDVGPYWDVLRPSLARSWLTPYRPLYITIYIYINTYVYIYIYVLHTGLRLATPAQHKAMLQRDVLGQRTQA